MIIVTGASGFIGSCLLRKLNDQGHLHDIVVVDDFYKDWKEVNLDNKFMLEWIHRDIFMEWFSEYGKKVDFFFHIGARTDTVDQDESVFRELNLEYSKDIWKVCVEHDIPLVYASSAATYGLGEHGFKDSHSVVSKLKPLNPYAVSKNDFDSWVLKQKKKPTHWAGLKFFNVYGPNEYHKGRMASVIFHTVKQILRTGRMNLFRSHNPDFRDGEQKRDFIYVKDVVDICFFFYSQWMDQVSEDPGNGLYNVGTGQARTFKDLAENTFQAMDQEPFIRFIDTPEDLRDNYQYFTEADVRKLRKAGYGQPFYTLEEGIDDYVRNYLIKENIW